MDILGDAIDTLIEEKNLRKTWILMIIIFGIAGVAIVLSYNYIMNSFIGQYLQSQSSQIKQIAQNFEGGNSIYLLPFVIFGNNIKTAIITWLSSLTIIIPILIVAFNGGLVGFVLPLALQTQPTEPSLVMFYLLVPHGAIEIPSVTLVASTFILMVNKGPLKMYKSSFGLLILSIILLAVAAVIESFLTRVIASMVYSIIT
ncbi:MAG: stage II sporulation protein M [Caldisphaera sp.]|nr:stage II sporulation protein M [Caldisphaera sp.]PMP61142.1 MAG: hypothetical protein C0201_00360 [Caldisphaera sp.]